MSQQKPKKSERAKIADATLEIQQILQEMGITSYEPEVVTELYGFVHTYTSRILTDAHLFARIANKRVIDVADVRLAAQIAAGHVKPPPSRNAVMKLAAERNKEPLPLGRSRNRLPLPPQRKCLFGVNYMDCVAKPPAAATATATAAAAAPAPAPAAAAAAPPPAAAQKPQQKQQQAAQKQSMQSSVKKLPLSEVMTNGEKKLQNAGVVGGVVCVCVGASNERKIFRINMKEAHDFESKKSAKGAVKKRGGD